MDKPMTFVAWCANNGKIPYSFGLEGAYEAGQKSMQAKVEELQKRVEGLEILLKRIHRYGLDAYNVSTCMSIRDELEQVLKGEG